MSGLGWILILIAVLVVVIIIVLVVVMGRGKREVRNRDRAGELRERAAADNQLLKSRQQRTEELEEQVGAARDVATTESEHAETLRTQAGESDELAARAAEEAEILGDEASHSRESFEEAVEDHDEKLREADRRDPDVPTDKHGNRTAEPEKGEEVPVIPEGERLDIGDDYSGDEFAEPDTEYLDPVEHERMTKLEEESPEAARSARTVDEPPPPAKEPAPRVDQDEPVQAQHADYISSDDVLETAEPALDPNRNRIRDAGATETGSTNDRADDMPRDEQGRRLDPYGNPVAEDRDL